MGRWTQYDEDDYRLPEGMKRIGYDSDTERYYFRDTDGSIWQSEEGSEYGELSKVSEVPPSLSADERANDDVEASPRTSRRNGDYELVNNDQSRPMAYSQSTNSEAYRSLFPFFLIIAVVLLLIWRLILAPNLSTAPKNCPEDTSSYWVQPGDSCWEISRLHGCTFERFKELNPKVQCEHLMPGTAICLPPLKSSLLGTIPQKN